VVVVVVVVVVVTVAVYNMKHLRNNLPTYKYDIAMLDGKDKGNQVY